METNIPKLIQVEITCVTGTSIIFANSFAVTNSVTFKIFDCNSCSNAAASAFAALSSLLLRRILVRCANLLDLPAPLNLARVALI